MIAETDRLQCTIDEYQALLGGAVHKPHKELRPGEWRELEQVLSHDAEWTPRGAEAVLLLARKYGSFILRNALAIAVALGIEDGEAAL